MKIDELRVPGGFAGTYHSGTLTIEDREFSKRNGYFWFCLDMGTSSARLDPNQARQLRDEITAFLGETESPHLICDHKNLCTHARWYKKEADVALRAANDLHDANAALRRDNADLTVQKDRLIAENEALRQRVAYLESVEKSYESYTKSLERKLDEQDTADEVADDTQMRYALAIAENERLRQRVASLEKDSGGTPEVLAKLYTKIEELRGKVSDATELQDQVKHLQRRNAEQFLTINNRDKVIASYKDANDRLMEQLAGWEDASRDAAHTINHLQGQKTKFREENDRLRQRVASLENDNADLHLAAAAHEVEYNHMRDITEGFIDNAKSLLAYFGYPTSAH